MSRSVQFAVTLLSVCALAVMAAPAQAAPAAIPSKRALTASPGATVSVHLALRGVTRCAMTVAHRTKGIRVAGRREATFSFRLAAHARAGVYRVGLHCPPARARVVWLRIRRTAANRHAGARMLAGRIVATAPRPSTAPAAAPGATAAPVAPKPSAAKSSAAKPSAAKPRPSAARPANPAPAATTSETDPLAGAPVDSQDPSATPYAAFTTRQGAGTTTTLDASASRGTNLSYSWQIDGVAGPTGAVADVRPTIGVHRIRLTVTGEGRTTHTERNVAIAWRGTPYVAQIDNANLTNLSNPFPTSLLAPWRTQSCVNNGYSLVNRADGVGVFTVHQGDHPTQGGDRCAVGLNEAYTPYINPGGQRPNELRFYRVETGVPADHPADIGHVFQNFAEWHGKASGGSVLKIGVDGANRNLRIDFSPLVRGVWQPPMVLDNHPLAPGTWHDYVVEIRWSTDPRVGYVRIYREGICRTCGDPHADSQGRVFGATLKTFTDGSSEVAAFGVQNYRARVSATGAPMPPTTVLHRNTMVGPTMASVFPSGS